MTPKVNIGYIIAVLDEVQAAFSPLTHQPRNDYKLSGIIWGAISSFAVALYPIILKKFIEGPQDKWSIFV